MYRGPIPHQTGANGEINDEAGKTYEHGLSKGASRDAYPSRLIMKKARRQRTSLRETDRASDSRFSCLRKWTDAAPID